MEAKLQRRGLNRSGGESRDTASLLLPNAPVPTSSTVVTPPPPLVAGGRLRIIPVCPDTPAGRCSLPCPRAARKEIGLSVFLARQNRRQLRPLVGLASFYSPRGHLLLQYGGSGRNTESFPAPVWGLLLSCLFAQCRSFTKTVAWMFGSTIMVTNQKGERSERLSCPTCNPWGLFLLCFKFFTDKYQFPFHELEETEKSKSIQAFH